MNTVASSWEWSELWTSERSDGVGRTSEQTLHSFPQPFKQPGVTMETPLCVFPNYPNPLHILSHTHRDTHKNTKKKTQTHTHTFWTDNPLPPSMHTNTVNSHQVTHSFSTSPVYNIWHPRGSGWYSQRAPGVSWPRWWPAGVWSWPGCACPPLWSGHGGPRWGAPSWASLGSSPPETQKQPFFKCTAQTRSIAADGGRGFHFFFSFGSVFWIGLKRHTVVTQVWWCRSSDAFCNIFPNHNILCHCFFFFFLFLSLCWYD